jgi:hypothetical protein
MVTSKSKKIISKSTEGLAPLDGLLVPPTLVSAAKHVGGSTCLPAELPRSPLFVSKQHNKHIEIKDTIKMYSVSQMGGSVATVRSSHDTLATST